MRTTIRQVAETAGVSAVTVSNVLRGLEGEASAETRQRVLAAARNLNYVPVKPPTVQNRHVETRAIGLVPTYAKLSHNILDNLTNGGICEGARKHGYDILIMLRDEADWMVNRQHVRFLDRRSDGFIFVSGGMGEWEGALNLLAEHRIPTVVCYRRDVPPAVAWVDPDNEGIVRQLLECFQRHGHRRVAYLTMPKVVPESAMVDPNWLVSASGSHLIYDTVQRCAAFESAMARDIHLWEHHLTLPFFTPEWQIIPEVLPVLRRAGITGVLCDNDVLAVQFLDMIHAAGLRVPQDISVAGIDDLPQAAAHGLTSVAFGYGEVGRLAVEAWIQLRAGKAPAQCCQVVPTRLVERTSVAAPRQ
jgi:LacI family transcriptional regulator